MNKNLLYKYFDGQASDSEKKEIGKWLAASPKHEELLIRERIFFDAAILLVDDFAEAPEIKLKSAVRKPIWYELLKIAAVVAITSLAALFLHKVKIESIANNTNIVTVPAGQRVNLILPDGTNIWLNALSELQYPAAFSGSSRNVKLNGEAFFDVAHKEDLPFIVETEKCNIEVLGTKFNVEAYSNSEEFRTALFDGLVKISDNNDSNALILHPSFQAELVEGKLKLQPIEYYDYYRWRDGLICFKDAYFEDLMQRFEKCYGVQIMVQNDKLKDVVFSGKLRVADGIDNALRVFQKDVNYSFERSKDGSVIYIK